MTTTSAIPAAINYLVSAAGVAFAAPTQVVDGPMIVTTQLSPNSRVWIGADPSNPSVPAAEGTQDFADIGARSRNEDFDITCAIEFWSGDPTAALVRAGAFGMLATFEKLLRGVPGTGGPGDVTMNGAVLWSQVTGPVTFEYESDDAGLIGRIVFRVGCRARLTTS